MKVEVTAAATFPITLAEARMHLRVSSTSEDDLIEALIEAATDYAEKNTGEYFTERTATEYFDGWPLCNCGDCFELGLTPVATVTSVNMILDGATDYSVFSAANYTTDTKGDLAKIVLKDTAEWPTLENLPNSVKVIYSVGLAAANVPKTIKQALLLMIGFWYENREDIPVNELRNHRVRSAESLLNLNKKIRF